MEGPIDEIAGQRAQTKNRRLTRSANRTTAGVGMAVISPCLEGGVVKEDRELWRNGPENASP